MLAGSKTKFGVWKSTISENVCYLHHILVRKDKHSILLLSQEESALDTVDARNMELWDWIVRIDTIFKNYWTDLIK